jgi:hypothetical protein
LVGGIIALRRRVCRFWRLGMSDAVGRDVNGQPGVRQKCF